MGFFDSAFNVVKDIGGIQLDVLTGGAYSNAKSVEQTNAKSIEQADKQMSFQERMSSTAYQRAVEDMRKAGLNPALAYQNGPASAPSGAMASLEAPRKGDVAAGAVNTAMKVAGFNADLSNTKSQTGLNLANQNSANEQAAIS